MKTSLRLLVAVVFLLAALSKVAGAEEVVTYLAQIPALHDGGAGLLLVLLVTTELTIGVHLLLNRAVYFASAVGVLLSFGFVVYQVGAPFFIQSIKGCPCIRVSLLAEYESNFAFRLGRAILLLAGCLVVCYFHRRRAAKGDRMLPMGIAA